MGKATSWHIGIAAEAFAASLSARLGYDVSVQYGANQPEYDLIITKGEKMLKVSVKGSQDGGWGLTQSFKKGITYHEAIDKWLQKHKPKTIFCLVQFKGVALTEMPRVYLAAPEEIAEELRKAANGRGETVLREEHHWTDRALAAGTVDKIPDNWTFSRNRIEELFNIT